MSVLKQSAEYLLQLSRYSLLTKNEFKIEEQQGRINSSNFTAFDEIVLNSLKEEINWQCQASASLLEKVIQGLTARGIITEANETLSKKLSWLIPFMKTTEILLSIGGDDRLTLSIEKKKENKYLSSTVPRDDVIRRGSCTCSTLTSAGYEEAERLRQIFVEKVLSILDAEYAVDCDMEKELVAYFESLNTSVVQRLRQLAGMTSSGSSAVEDDLVLFPSGSDAEYLPLVVALIRSFNLCLAKGVDAKPSSEQGGLKVYNFVTAAGEVGSGTPNAAMGQHFSPLVPRGTANAKASGTFIDGFNGQTVELIQFKPRNSSGNVTFQEEGIVKKVNEVLNKEGDAGTSVAVIHLVCGSKTGLIYPSLPTIETLLTQFPGRITVVVDACQLRCRLDLLSTYLQKEFLILVTGSKFFTGPPFCGAVLLPKIAVRQIESHLTYTAASNASVIPAQGLLDYITSYEIGSSLVQFKKFLQSNSDALATKTVAAGATVNDVNKTKPWFNFGLTLRWTVSLAVMEKYHALSLNLVSEFTRLWVQHVKALTRGHAPLLTLLEEEEARASAKPDAVVAEGTPQAPKENVGEVNTIVSITLRVVDAAATTEGTKLRALTVDEYKEFHRLLTVSLATDDERAAKTMLGQPVKLSDAGLSVLRIALGADIVVQALQQSLSTTGLNEDVLKRMLQDAFRQGSHSIAPTRAFSSLAAQRNIFAADIERLLAQDAVVVKKMSQLCLHWSDKASSDATTSVSNFSVGSLAAAVAERSKAISRTDTALLRNTTTSGNGSLAFDSVHVPLITLPRLQSALTHLGKTNRENDTVAVLYDLDALTTSFTSVNDAFKDALSTGGSSSTKLDFLHCFAVKSCPLSYILHCAVEQGLGLECASIVEVQQALVAGANPANVVYDSPCKTLDEIRFAMEYGVRINANSYEEVDKIAQVYNELTNDLGLTVTSPIGLRVNPLVGAGKNSQLSTATKYSKFGVPLFSSDDVTDFMTLATASPTPAVDSVQDPATAKVLNTFLAYPWLSGVMCHVGSQGMPLSLMVQGVQRISLVANLIDALTAHENTDGVSRIRWLDIGGGLSANYDSDSISPSFVDYANAIREQAPEIYGGASTRLVITEFGKSLITKCAAIVTNVEDVLTHGEQDGAEIEGPLTAVTHAGADLLLRTAYCPEKFPHRLTLLDAHNQEVSTQNDEEDESKKVEKREERTVAVVGPLCFSGDVLAASVRLPRPRRGDKVVLWDTGANTISLFSRHCSRASPVVYGFRTINWSEEETMVVATIRERETDGEVVSFWC